MYGEFVEDMRKVMLDAPALQAASLTRLENSLNGEIDLVDPNNPFLFLLENTTMITTGMMQNVEADMRKVYPILAKSKDDLYHHIGNTEINNIIATPSEAIFNIFFNINDIKNNGIENDFSYEVSIPKNSTIRVSDTVFTLLNDVVVKYFKNGSSYVEVIFSELDLAIKINKVLESSIVTNAEGTKFILASIPVKQVKRYSVRESILLKQPFIKDVVIDDNFTYITASSISTELGREIELEKTFSEFVFNPNKPTILIKPKDTTIRLEIPSVYIINNDVTSYVDMEIYTTKGDIDLPLSTYMSDDFEMTFSMLDATMESSNIINSISIIITASTNTYGGRDEITFESLKEKIIEYSTGDNIVPVTIKEVEDLVKNNGFYYMFATDTIVKREFAISKYLGNLNFNTFSNIDLFTGKLKLDLASTYSSGIVFDDASIVISPFQRFKYKDGTLAPLTNIEAQALTEASLSDINTYNVSEVFFNPFLYILDFKDKLRTRVYDINKPLIDNAVTVYNNSPVTPVKFLERNVRRSSFSFEFMFLLEDANKLTQLDLSKVFGQLDVKINDISIISYRGVVRYNDNIGTYIYFNIPIKGYVNDEDKFLLTEAIGNVTTAFVDIKNRTALTLYSTDEELSDVDGYDTSSVDDDDATCILYKEEFDLTLAENLNAIYRNYNVNFLERKFKTYDVDVPLIYKEDIYKLDEDGTVLLVEDEETGELELVLKYKAGDTVIDEDSGEPIILHRAGDVMLDDNDRPIIDYINGLSHIVDIMLIEDSFTRCSDSVYKDYMDEYLRQLSLVATEEIPILEESLIEDTKFKLTTLNTLDNVTIKVNNEWVKCDNFIEPTLTINILRGTDLLVDDVLEAKLAIALQEIISNDFIFSVAEETLKAIIGGDVISVRISNVTDMELSSIEYEEKSGRFILTKQLIRNNSGESIVTSKIKINIVTI